MRKLIYIGLLLALTMGCSTVGNKQIMNQDFMNSVQVGATTKDQVKELLGEPQATGQQQGGQNWEVWRYTCVEKSINAACFIPLVDLAAGRQTINSKTVDIYFNEAGVVTDTKAEANVSERKMPIGTIMLGAAAVGVAAGAAASRYNSYNYPRRAVVNTIPTGGGGSYTTIKWYK